MEELTILARSSVPAQRVVALQTLSRILERRRIALDQGRRPVPLVRVVLEGCTYYYDSVCIQCVLLRFIIPLFIMVY